MVSTQVLTGNRVIDTLEPSISGTLAASSVTRWLNRRSVILSSESVRVMGDEITNNIIRTISNFSAMDSTAYNSGQVTVYTTRQRKGNKQ